MRKKIEKLQAFDLNYFLEKNCFLWLWFPKHIYQPIFSRLDLKEDKGTEYTIAWKSKVLFKSRLEPLYKVSVPNIKRFGCKIGIKLKKT